VLSTISAPEQGGCQKSATAAGGAPVEAVPDERRVGDANAEASPSAGRGGHVHRS